MACGQTTCTVPSQQSSIKDLGTWQHTAWRDSTGNSTLMTVQGVCLPSVELCWWRCQRKWKRRETGEAEAAASKTRWQTDSTSLSDWWRVGAQSEHFNVKKPSMTFQRRHVETSAFSRPPPRHAKRTTLHWCTANTSSRTLQPTRDTRG